MKALKNPISKAPSRSKRLGSIECKDSLVPQETPSIKASTVPHQSSLRLSYRYNKSQNTVGTGCSNKDDTVLYVAQQLSSEALQHRKGLQHLGWNMVMIQSIHSSPPENHILSGHGLFTGHGRSLKRHLQISNLAERWLGPLRSWIQDWSFTLTFIRAHDFFPPSLF